MSVSRFSFLFSGMMAVVFVSCALPALAQTERVLYSFCPQTNCADGLQPAVALAVDKQGNLYGTTGQGGANGYGVVFKLSVDGIETVLHSFGATPLDGIAPSAGLLIDSKGNLYGTTVGGGAQGLGTVFEVSAAGKERVLYSFCSRGGPNCSDGYGPNGALIADIDGNLYGTTLWGGSAYGGGGTVFKLRRDGTEIVLHSFSGYPNDGYNPFAGLVLDAQGNLYGTTAFGGYYQMGTVFRVSPGGTETVLYNFLPYNSSTDGYFPFGAPILDSQGNLYGTTSGGGTYGPGTVFKLSPSGTETILHSFGGTITDGIQPQGGLLIDAVGNIYGTTSSGGIHGGGIVFELGFDGTETILHNFGQGTDSRFPGAGLVIGIDGLYGTTTLGGNYGEGTVFVMMP